MIMKIYEQTTDYTCEACSIMNALRYKGFITDDEMNTNLEYTIAKEIGTTDPEGADTDLELRYLAKYFSDPHIVKNGTTSDLNKLIASQSIAMVYTKLYDAHWMVYIGRDKELNMQFLDSAISAVRTMTDQEFTDVWYDDQYFGGSPEYHLPGIHIPLIKR